MITGYLYALFVALLLTYVISKFYKVKNNILQGILITLIYIFIVHFAQGDDCLLNKIIGKTEKQQYNNKSNNAEKFNLNNLAKLTDGLLSTSNLNSRVHANDLYDDNVLNENRLEYVPQNNMYYALSNQFYPMNNRNQINQQDCTNDGSCLIPEDSLNMHPIRQSLSQVLPVPNIGPQEMQTMNQLNPKLNVNINYPLPIESPHKTTTFDIVTFYDNSCIVNNKINELIKDQSCHKCIPKSDNNKITEKFGLFDTYNMGAHTDTLYKNAPLKNSQICKTCVVGTCVGDLCSVQQDRFTRNDPLNM
jgi:hypothetical protein